MSTFWTDIRLWQNELHEFGFDQEVAVSSRTFSTPVLENRSGPAVPDGTISHQQFLLAAGTVLAIIASGLYLGSQYLIP
jgi:hypothetical protein